MQFHHKLLHLIADNSRWALVAGLAIGILFPQIAGLVKPWVGHWVAVLLFLAALRIDPKDALGSRDDYKQVAFFIGVFQLLLPSLAAIVFLIIDFTGPFALALLIVLASAPISGSPSLTMITGHNPAPALRLLVTSTALLPLTVFIPFSLMPVIGNPAEVSWIAFRLFLIIFSASLAAFLIRHFFMSSPTARTIKSIDGLTAIAMAIVVIGLMTGFSEALENRPLDIPWTLAIVFAVNIGTQILVWYRVKSQQVGEARASFAVCAGNKNMAIFLAALPATVTDPILLFIACYQIPMYLTPTILGWMYGKLSDQR